MKEIEVIIQEVKIESHCCGEKPKVTIEAESVNGIVPIKAGKTYKLVEDDTDNQLEKLIKRISDSAGIAIEELRTNVNYLVGTPKLADFTIDEKTRFHHLLCGTPISRFNTAVRIPIKVAETKEFKPANPSKCNGKNVKCSWFDELITYKSRVMFNGNATILEIGSFKTVVKCHEDDEFTYYIGLGLALSRYYEKQPSTKKEIKYLKDELNYKKLAHYCVYKYFGFDMKLADKFLISCEMNKWVDLCVK